MKWLLIFLISLSAFAHEGPHEIECVPSGPTHLVDKLMDWFSAKESQISNAPCKTQKVPSIDQMKNFITTRATGSREASIHGVKFKNESPALIEAFRDFTTARDSWGILEAREEQKKIQNEYSIPSECHKVLCAMEKIWGKETAVKMLYIKLKHNFNTSELAFQNSDRWNPDELDDVLIGLEDLPPYVIPVGRKNQRLTHFTRGYTLSAYEDRSVSANAVIMFFDHWGRKSGPARQYTVFHELAHNISSRMNEMDESPEWLNLSGWIKKGDHWEVPGPACFASEYATENPWEDYAESVSAYRYNGKEFKTKCPAKYQHLKDKVFKGFEYTDKKSCGLSKP